jgi:hypothetical protein
MKFLNEDNKYVPISDSSLPILDTSSFRFNEHYGQYGPDSANIDVLPSMQQFIDSSINNHILSGTIELQLGHYQIVPYILFKNIKRQDIIRRSHYNTSSVLQILFNTSLENVITTLAFEDVDIDRVELITYDNNMSTIFSHVRHIHVSNSHFELSINPTQSGFFGVRDSLQMENSSFRDSTIEKLILGNHNSPNRVLVMINSSFAMRDGSGDVFNPIPSSPNLRIFSMFNSRLELTGYHTGSTLVADGTSSTLVNSTFNDYRERGE